MSKINKKELTTENISRELFKFGDNVKYLRGLSKESYEIIGGHVRHILDHINAIIDGGVDSPRKGIDGFIDYPKSRSRGSLVESSYTEFNKQIIDLVNKVERQNIDLSKELTIRDYTSFREEKLVSSTYEREIFYFFQHMTHHLYIMKLLLESKGIKVPDEGIGLAPSTKIYNENNRV